MVGKKVLGKVGSFGVSLGTIPCGHTGNNKNGVGSLWGHGGVICGSIQTPLQVVVYLEKTHKRTALNIRQAFYYLMLCAHYRFHVIYPPSPVVAFLLTGATL